MAANTKDDICIICGKIGIRNYPLKKCTTCDSLLHRRCAQKSVGTTINCNSCLSSKVKGSRKSENGKPDTPPSNIRSKVTPTANRMITSLANISSKNSQTQGNNITHKTTRMSTHNTINKPCCCTDNINSLLDKWEKILQTKFDIQLDIIQKNLYENYNNIKKEITTISNNLMQNKQRESSLLSATQQMNDELKKGNEQQQHLIPTLSNKQLLSNAHSNNFIFSTFHNNNNSDFNSLTQKQNINNINNIKNCSVNPDRIINKKSFLINDILHTNTLESNINLRPNYLYNNFTDFNSNDSTTSNMQSIISLNTEPYSGNISSSSGNNMGGNSNNLNLNFNSNINNNQLNKPASYADGTIFYNQLYNPENMLQNKDNRNLSDNNNGNLSSTHITPSLLQSSYTDNINKTRIEEQEIYISGFMKLPSSEHDLKKISLAILRGIYPSLNMSDILNVRLVHSRSEN